MHDLYSFLAPSVCIVLKEHTPAVSPSPCPCLHTHPQGVCECEEGLRHTAVVFAVGLVKSVPCSCPHRKQTNGLVPGCTVLYNTLHILLDSVFVCVKRAVPVSVLSPWRHSCRTFDAIKQEANEALPASCWTRSFAINPLYLMGGLVVLIVYFVLPIYLYTDKLKSACCDADFGTKLHCDAPLSTHSISSSTLQEDAIALDVASDCHGTQHRHLLSSTVQIRGCVAR